LAILVPVSALSLADDSHSIVPGYERFREHTLSAADAGRVLISELNCQSCHGELNGNRLAGRQAPILTEVGQRTGAEYVRRFLANPQSEKPGTAMPGFAAEKLDATTIDSLAAFLTNGHNWRPAAVGADAIRRGEKLFHQVGCAACHSDQRSDAEVEAIRRGANPGQENEDEDDDDDAEQKDVTWKRPVYAMPLGKLEQKYSLGSLITFLREPHQVRPSGRMPSLNLTPEEARDIASYLLKDVQVEANIHFEYFEGDWQKLPDFSTLKAVNAGNTTDFSVGVSPRQDVFGLRFSGWLQLPRDGNYRFFLSSDDGARLIVNGQVMIDNDGIHPAGFRDNSQQMKAGAHELVVEYFEFQGQEELALEIEGPELPRQPLAGLITLTHDVPSDSASPVAVPSNELIQNGRMAFQSLGCAACHQHGDGDSRILWTGTAPKFVDGTMKSIGGCLAETPVPALPKFSLTAQQREDISAAIEDNRIMRKMTAEEAARIHLQQTMLTFNCYACHARGTIGGVNESTNHLFVGSIPEMGDEGRIPPALDGAGDKLNPAWLKAILNEGAKDRPYMATRMPKFGESHVGDLVGSLGTLDIQAEVPAVSFAEPDHRVKADARLMVGDKALSCIKCHIFDRYAATGIQSLDMTTMTRRLRRDWFHRYLANPQQYRPGTRMPAAWPNGRSVVPDILHGDPATQIEAIWVYLS
ncbi:MAG: c-type cytochrome, partial [Planctomycetota bacterium]